MIVATRVFLILIPGTLFLASGLACDPRPPVRAYTREASINSNKDSSNERPRDAGNCPISKCEVNGKYAYCNCYEMAGPMEVPACSLALNTCYIFGTSSIADGFKYCGTATGALLSLCNRGLDAQAQ